MNKFPILFCESPIDKNRVDSDFEDEFLLADQNGFSTHLFSFEDITDPERARYATRKIEPADRMKSIIYRGWMLTPAQYATLYEKLLLINYKLINNVKEYQNCHYLPDSLKFIGNMTPRTIFEPFENDESIEKLVRKAGIFDHHPVMIKDYVKSEKHDWDSACFVKDASDSEDLRKTIKNLIRLRGKYLNEGIVVRKFIELNDLTIHSKSGMPLTEEYRLFFCNKQLVGIFDYWEEGEYSPVKPDTGEFENIALHIESNFFSMDIARQKDGQLIIIELGDGQVAGLPQRSNKDDFYRNLRRITDSMA